MQRECLLQQPDIKKRSKSPDSKIVSVAETQAATGGEFEVMQQNRQEALVEAIQ